MWPLSAEGLTRGEISAHLAGIYGASVSKETITPITDRILESMSDWQNRPADPAGPVIFIDAIVVKTGEGQVANRPIYVAVGVTADGTRGYPRAVGRGGRRGRQILVARVGRDNQPGNPRDVCIVVCDGLKGLPEAVNTVWSEAIVWTCVVHLLRGFLPLRFARGLAGYRPGPQGDLHRPDRSRRPGPLRPCSQAAGRPSIRPSSGCGTQRGLSSCRSLFSSRRSGR